MRRRLILVFAAVLMLSACISTLQGAYDDRAREEECARTRGEVERAMC
jgi:protein involved in sex pheromone biosynthesis